MGSAGWGLDSPPEPTTLGPSPAPEAAASSTTVQWLHVWLPHRAAQCEHVVSAGSGFMSCSVLGSGWYSGTETLQLAARVCRIPQ